MAAMPPIDPNNPRWQGRIDKIKKLAFNKGFRHAVQGAKPACGFTEEVYANEYARGYRQGQARRRVDVA
jgi:hypothetical protein